MPDGRSARSAAQADTASTHRLTLVVAAPGWGKTRLLRQLAMAPTSIDVARPPSGWTPLALARGIVEGLRSNGASLDAPLPDAAAPDSPDHLAQTVALAARVGEVAASLPDDVVVLLDDVETQPDDPLERFLEALVLHLPSTVHLVVACRRAPALRLARLRAGGEIARIDTSDLAVTVDDLGELDLDPVARDTVSELARATAGWPLAVQLAAAALRHAGPLGRADLVDRLLAPDAVLFDYLAEEVFAGLDERAQELLTLAAHLPFVDDDLLRAIGHDALTRLAGDVTVAGTFLEHGLGGRCRATLLGGEFLRRARPRPPEDELRRAVDALLVRDEVEAALVLAAHLGDPEVARRVVLGVDRPDRVAAALAPALEVAGRAGAHHRLTELRGDLEYLRGEWDAALRDYALAAASGDAGSPRLARKRGVILYLRGRLDEAEAAVAAARLDGTDPSEEAQVLAWRAAMRWMRGDVEGCEASLVPAREAAERSGDDAALATVHTTSAMLAALRGDRRSNARSYRLALEHAERAGDVVQIVRIRSNRGSHHMEEGKYQEAIDELSAAIEEAELIGSETFSALAYLNRGETQLRMGRLDDALRDLQRAADIWERIGSELVDYATGLLGEVQFLRGQRSEALALHAQATAWAERRGDVQALVPALIGTAKVLLVDDPDRAAEPAERAIATEQAVWQPHALLIGGWVDHRRGDGTRALERCALALELAQRHQDRPAVAEALLLRSTICDPPSERDAAESQRLWQDLGNPIGEARATLALAGFTAGAEREELVSRAEALLIDAGAWGPLAEAHQARTAAVSSPIAISTLGGFRVTRDGVPIEIGEWGSRKARDFVKLLVARRGAPVVRDEVADLLWPEETDRSARRLSVLLSTVRSVLDPRKAHPPDHFVAADHDTVWLVREHADVDVEMFLREAAEGRRLLADGDVDKGAATLAGAAARYLGDFCADDPYADWAAGTRELTRHTFVETAARLGALADQRDEHGDAVRHRLRILDVDPYDEQAHLDLISALSAQRRHGEARRAYRTYCDRLAELDLHPAPFPAAGRRA